MDIRKKKDGSLPFSIREIPEYSETAPEKTFFGDQIFRRNI